jgi:SAM-dependent methyltransferase
MAAEPSPADQHAGSPAEAQLARLALDLGAAGHGGPLSGDERDWLARAGALPASPAAQLDQARAAILSGGDPLGDWLCRLRPASRRRRLGAFYTSPALVDAMLAWLMAHSPDCLIDPGCGSGRFAVAAARRQPDLPIIAIDVDPLATLLTRAALAVAGARATRVIHGDYLTLDALPRRGRAGFVANPPYVRHHDLTPAAKTWAALAGLQAGIPVSALAGLHALFYLATALQARPGDVGCFITSAEWLDTRYGQVIRRLLVERLGLRALAGLHALFYLATALQARPGDVGCFITSAEWLDTRYGQVIRRLLVERLGLRALAVIDPRAMPFADAMTTAAIAGFEVGAAPERVALGLIDAPAALDLLAITTVVERDELRRAARWSPLLRRVTAPAALPQDGSASTVPLSAIARVHRGVATGSNEFFVLTRARAAALGLLPWCRPAITRAQEVLEADGVVRDGPERRLLLVVPPDVDRAAFPALDAYLRQGEATVARRYLPSHRRPWWYLGPLVAPPIVASYMARQAPAFARNPDGLLLLNIAHGIYPREPLDDARLARLVAQLNAGRETFRGHGRTYQGGLEKFEPREMEALPIRLEEITGATLHAAAPVARSRMIADHVEVPCPSAVSASASSSAASRASTRSRWPRRARCWPRSTPTATSRC